MIMQSFNFTRRMYFLYKHFIMAVKWLETGDKTFID